MAFALTKSLNMVSVNHEKMITKRRKMSHVVVNVNPNDSFSFFLSVL